MAYHRLTPEQKEFFERWYSQMRQRSFQRSFKRRFGIEIDPNRLKQYARRHRFNETPPNYYTLQELAELVPYRIQALRYKVKSGALKSKRGRKGAYLIPAKQAVEFIEACESALPWPAITVNSAAIKLGYKRDRPGRGNHSLNTAIRKYGDRFPVVRFLNVLWMPEAIYEICCQYMLETESARMDWEYVLSEYEKQTREQQENAEVRDPGDS